jgi:hypothetical protein
MSALSAERPYVEREGVDYVIPAAAAKTFYKGAILALSATGYGTPAATATGLSGLGVVTETVDNSTGAAGAVSVKYRRGVFRFNNDGTAAVTATHINGNAYAVDDNTVASTDGSSTRSAVGKIVDVDAQGVWVKF